MRARLLVLAAASLATLQVASAADMPVKAPIYKAPAAAVYNWNGFYAGVNGGYGWGANDADFTGEPANGAGNDFVSRIFTGAVNFSPNTGTQSIDANGAIGGAQLGYNWQFAPTWVAGFEADIQASGVKGDATTTSPSVSLRLDSEQKLKWFGTLRGRLGYLVNPNLLVYATGGLAYGETEGSATVTSATGFIAVGATTTITCAAGPVCLSGQDSKTAAGWTAGGGAEWAVTRNISVKGEYLHIDLGNESVLMTAQAPSTGNGTITATFHNSFDIVRAGLNWKF